MKNYILNEKQKKTNIDIFLKDFKRVVFIIELIIRINKLL